MTKQAIFEYEYLEELNQTMQNLVAPDIEPLSLKEVWDNTDNQGRINLIVNYINAIQHKRIENYIVSQVEKAEKEKEGSTDE